MTETEKAILNDFIGTPDGLELVLAFYQPCPGRAHSLKAQQMIDTATAALVERFGASSSGKRDVSIHEAGHAAIAHLVGYRVKNVGVWTEPSGQWAGCVEVDYPEKKPFDSWLWKEALARIAGYIAERLSGRDHPAKTVHEKLWGIVICRYMDELRDTESGYHFAQAINQCEEALEANRELFEEVGYRLLATNRVSGAEINSLMKGAVQLTISPLTETTRNEQL